MIPDEDIKIYELWQVMSGMVCVCVCVDGRKSEAEGRGSVFF